MTTSRYDDDIIFRPLKVGLSQVLGELEAEIMEFIWEAESLPVPAREVADTVGRRRGIKYITVVTVMNKLCRKKLLGRRRKGRAFHYRPRLSRTEFLERVSRDILRGMLELSPEVAVNSFVELIADDDLATLEQLVRRIEERDAKSSPARAESEEAEDV